MADVPDPLSIFFELERRFLERLSTHVEPCPSGTAYLDDDYPTRYYSNVLMANAIAGETSTDGLIDEADRALKGRDHRRIIVRPESIAQRFAPSLVERGFEDSREVVMMHGRPPDREGHVNVEELTFDAISPLILETYREEGSADALASHFTAQHGKFERSIGARFFASRVGGELAGSCELWTLGSDALVENVFTLERHRGRGIARAVVLRAIRAAGEAGAERVFVLTDDVDWPKALYARLGFDPIGREWTFTKAPVS